MRIPILALILLCCAALLIAQEDERQMVAEMTAQMQAISDSLLQSREASIQEEFGFSDSDKLRDVAARLEVTDLAKWQAYLELEPNNPKLDDMTWRQLGISPYRALLAKQYSIYGFTELSTLSEVAGLMRLPIKKLRQELGLDPLSKQRDSQSLQSLGRVPEDIIRFKQQFQQNRLHYGLSVTGVGMLVVFSALLITSIIISQLHKVNKPPKPADQTLRISHKGKLISTPKDMNRNVIAAAITALHLHKQSIEERRRLLLTFKHTPTNQWHASGMMDMPNRYFLRKRS